MNRELFVKKKKTHNPNPKPFEWEHGSYNACKIKNGSWVYYDYFGKDIENPDNNRYEENPHTFAWSYTDDKYAEYKSLVITHKHIKIIENNAPVTPYGLKRWICDVILKEENEATRERNNQKAKERRERNRG